MALLEKHGGFRHLKSFRVAQVSYGITEKFCESCLDCASRTREQMVQAARSGARRSDPIARRPQGLTDFTRWVE